MRSGPPPAWLQRLAPLVMASVGLTPQLVRAEPDDRTPPTEAESVHARELDEVDVAARALDEVDVALGVDLPITLSAALLAGGLVLGRDAMVRDRCAPTCNEADLNPLDAPLAGTYSGAAATAADVLVGVNLALPFVLGTIDLAAGSHPEGAVGYGEDTLILAETLAVSMAAQELVTLATQRPRPFVYGDEVDDERRHGANAYLSFYSGHTANSFAMATAYSYLFGLRHPGSPWRAGMWALTHGLAALDGYLRIASGYHFPTDVLVGAGVGSAVGLVVPWLHRRTAGGPEEPICTPTASVLGLSGLVPLPTPLPGGWGVSLVGY